MLYELENIIPELSSNTLPKPLSRLKEITLSLFGMIWMIQIMSENNTFAYIAYIKYVSVQQLQKLSSEY